MIEILKCILAVLKDKILVSLEQIVASPGIAPVAENGVVVYSNETSSGTIPAGKWSVSFLNTGSTTVTLQGEDFLVGQSTTMTGYYDNVQAKLFRLPSIAYNATGGNLAITIQD